VERIERLLCRLSLHDEWLVRAALADVDLSALDPKVDALVGLGALLSVDAATVSLRLVVDQAYRAGATEDEIVGVLLAIAPAVGHARTVAVARASLASLANRSAPAISPTSLAAVSGPNPGSESSCGAIRATSRAISASSALIVCESSRMRRSSSRAMRPRIVCSVRASRRATRGPQLP
jgi:alkylhydroperoxidase/carboxymuconolactone decarboxylase family protein YurZ